MPTIPAWKNPFNKKVLIHDHTKQRQQNDECRNVDAALRNQLLTAFEDTYISPLKNAFTGYFGSTTLRRVRDWAWLQHQRYDIHHFVDAV